MISFSIIIPIYNEKENIFNLVEEIYTCLKNIKSSFEIIIIDDCSDDLKDSDYQKLLSYNELSIIQNQKNLGQSLSMHKGIYNSKYSTIITLDGDGQNNPKDILSLLNIYKSRKYKLVGGLRLKRKDSFIKLISSRIANRIRSIILKDNCTDTGCSLKIFDKDSFLQFPVFNGMHRFIPALFTGFRHQTFFIEVDHRHRLYGQSK